ncbi:MAG TPA: hypothetical protein VJ875_08225 [Pyrinomonadaceae bacterium]|nr:hypothetical protein [Pyrinomonadaceae bacterium]
MKSIIGAFTLALFTLCLALPNLVHAGAEGDSASGSFKFVLDDGETRFVEFKANELGDGQAAGDVTFSDPAVIPVDDPDSPEKQKTAGMLVRAKLDCMDTIKNTAVMGGQIYDSNVPSAIGQLLVVEDNGLDGAKDRLAWGVYQQPGTWVPTDAERDDDKGATLTWLATDSERKDDVGIMMPVSKIVQCRTFPGAAYDFPEFKYAGGDLQVVAK